MNSNPAGPQKDAPFWPLFRFWWTDSLRQRVFLASGVVAVGIKIWLVLAFDMRAADAPVDDRLFVKLAESIVKGEWLGSYDQYTLCKGPFFPMWIAGAFLANIPLLLSYQLLHAVACTLVVAALEPIVGARPGRLALFILLLFDPATFSVTAVLTDRGGIYLPLTMIVLASVAAVLARLDRRPLAWTGWLLGLGLALAAFWMTREESVWIVPLLFIAAAYSLVRIWRKRMAPLLRTTLLLLPAGIFTAGVLCVCAMNYGYYGVFELIDFKSEGFERANGALMRVHPERWNQYANVPKDVRLKMYGVSPAFSELQEYFEGPTGQAWGRMAEDHLKGGTPSPKDIRGGFFVWALRDAVQRNGHYGNALEAEAYYNQLADEINVACSDGRLECGPERASLMPPWRREYASLAFQSFRRGLAKAVTIPNVSRPLPSVGAEDRLTIFEDIGRTSLSPGKSEYTIPPRLPNQARLDRYRLTLMRHIASVYRAVDVYATVCACIAFLVVCLLNLRARLITPTTAILGGMLASFIARIVILALVSVTSFEATGQRYILPLYPMLLLFWFLSFHDGAGRTIPVVVSIFKRVIRSRE